MAIEFPILERVSYRRIRGQGKLSGVDPRFNSLLKDGFVSVGVRRLAAQDPLLSARVVQIFAFPESLSRFTPAAIDGKHTEAVSRLLAADPRLVLATIREKQQTVVMTEAEFQSFSAESRSYDLGALALSDVDAVHIPKENRKKRIAAGGVIFEGVIRKRSYDNKVALWQRESGPFTGYLPRGAVNDGEEVQIKIESDHLTISDRSGNFLREVDLPEGGFRIFRLGHYLPYIENIKGYIVLLMPSSGVLRLGEKGVPLPDYAMMPVRIEFDYGQITVSHMTPAGQKVRIAKFKMKNQARDKQERMDKTTAESFTGVQKRKITTTRQAMIGRHKIQLSREHIGKTLEFTLEEGRIVRITDEEGRDVPLSDIKGHFLFDAKGKVIAFLSFDSKCYKRTTSHITGFLEYLRPAGPSLHFRGGSVRLLSGFEKVYVEYNNGAPISVRYYRSLSAKPTDPPDEVKSIRP